MAHLYTRRLAGFDVRRWRRSFSIAGGAGVLMSGPSGDAEIEAFLEDGRRAVGDLVMTRLGRPRSLPAPLGGVIRQRIGDFEMDTTVWGKLAFAGSRNFIGPTSANELQISRFLDTLKQAAAKDVQQFLSA